MKRADGERKRAYQASGREIFEAEDPKVLQHLRELLRPPSDAL